MTKTAALTVIPPNRIAFAVGARCTIHFTFTPRATGLRTGTLSVTSDAAGSPFSLGMSGVGYVPTSGASLSPISISWSSVTTGSATSPERVTPTSTGNAPLTVSTVSIGGRHPRDFWISETCTGRSLNPGATCTVDVVFMPDGTGSRTATLTIAHNAEGGSSNVALSGYGEETADGYLP